MVKPRATREHLGPILEDVLHNGFTIRKLETRPLTADEAEFLYESHQGKEFYEDLVAYMTSGPVVLLKLEKLDCSDVVGFWRLCMGETDSSKAMTATLRGRFGNKEVIRENAVHGSDSQESAERELEFFFPEK